MTTFRALPAVIGAALALFASVASAGLINEYTFDTGGVASDLTGVGGTASIAGTVATGPNVAVKAYSFNGSSWIGAVVRQSNGNALGVTSAGTDSPGQLGARLEGLVFDFGTTFYGSFRLDFSEFAGVDNFDIWSSTSGIDPNSLGSATQLASSGTTNPFISGQMFFRYVFVTNSDNGSGNCGSGESCFRVDNLRVVPEPGSLALVGGGLLLAGLARRRRQAAR